jgi:hypothetical protein
MTEAEQIMKRCQAGTRNYEEANNLHAACYGIIGKLLAQPEQEPVAWVSEDVCKGQYIDGRPRKIWWECEKGVGTAFYTHPPQRTWVGLTDEEISELSKGHIVRSTYARAIEAKLKELNDHSI